MCKVSGINPWQRQRQPLLGGRDMLTIKLIERVETCAWQETIFGHIWVQLCWVITPFFMLETMVPELLQLSPGVPANHRTVELHRQGKVHTGWVQNFVSFGRKAFEAPAVSQP